MKISLILLLLYVTACGGRERQGASETEGVSESASVVASAVRGASAGVLFLGTSLTAGYGIDPDSSYPAVIQRKIDLAQLDRHYVVRNAGLSGETSAGALRRIYWLLNDPFDIVVIETGANDGLRGLNADSTGANIEGIIAAVRARQPGARMLLAGMEAPVNLGLEYTARFRAVFTEVASRNKVVLIPFLLDGVAGVDTLNQSDGIHPNEAGARIVAENVWRVLRGMLNE